MFSWVAVPTEWMRSRGSLLLERGQHLVGLHGLVEDFGLLRKRLWYSGIPSRDSSHTKRRSDGWVRTFRTAASVRSVK
jgi:hypothetical protein